MLSLFFFVRNIIEIRRVFEKPIYQLTDVKRVLVKGELFTSTFLTIRNEFMAKDEKNLLTVDNIEFFFPLLD